MRSIHIFLIAISTFVFINYSIAQPMEEYARKLQKKIITLEQEGEDYQSKLRYYQGLPKALEVQKQKIRNLEQIRATDESEKKELQTQIAAETQRLKEMTTELSNLNNLIKETNLKLATTINDLNKSRKGIDSLVNINKGLRFMIDEAMSELSGFKQLNLGIKRKDGSFVYKVEQNDNKIRFVCPRDIGVFNCDMTHANFEISFYDKNNLSENSYFLVFYKKDENGQYVHHSHLQIGFNETESKYEDYRKYKSNNLGAVTLPKPLPGNQDYTVAVMELKSSSPNLNLLTLPHATAVNEGLIKATKTFVTKP